MPTRLFEFRTQPRGLWRMSAPWHAKPQRDSLRQSAIHKPRPQDVRTPPISPPDLGNAGLSDKRMEATNGWTHARTSQGLVRGNTRNQMLPAELPATTGLPAPHGCVRRLRLCCGDILRANGNVQFWGKSSRWQVVLRTWNTPELP